jgi:hypothetical protein
MDKEFLNKPVSSEILEEFVERKDELIKHTIANWVKNSEAGEAQTKELSEKYQAGLVFTLDMLTTAMELGDLDLLEDQIKWALIRLPHDGISHNDLIENLVLLKKEFEEFISQENLDPIVFYLDWMIEKIKNYS